MVLQVLFSDPVITDFRVNELKGKERRSTARGLPIKGKRGGKGRVLGATWPDEVIADVIRTADSQLIPINE